MVVKNPALIEIETLMKKLQLYYLSIIFILVSGIIIFSSIILKPLLNNVWTPQEEIELKIPPLLLDKHLYIKSIHRISDDIIVRTREYIKEKDKTVHLFWILDNNKGIFKPFYNYNKERILAVSKDSEYTIISTSTGKEIHVNFIEQASRSITINTDEIEAGETPFIPAANSRFTYLVFKKRIIEISKERVIKSILFDNYINSSIKDIPDALCITEKELIIGYDNGEWESGAYSFNIGENGISDKPEQILTDNICAVEKDKNGKVWIASTSYILPKFYSYDDKKVTRIGKPIVFISKQSGLSSMTVNSKNEIVLAASTGGLFTYKPGHDLGTLWEGSLTIECNFKNFRWTGTPNGIVEKDNKYFISYYKLGVIRFEKVDKINYVPSKQILFDEYHPGRID